MPGPLQQGGGRSAASPPQHADRARGQITSFPTFKWFVGGELTAARRATTPETRTADALTAWAQRHADPPPVLTSAEQIDAQIESVLPARAPGGGQQDGPPAARVR